MSTRHWILSLLVNAVALWAAVRIVPGIVFEGGPLTLLGIALAFGVMNVLVRPVLQILSCSILILTLGLFTFVINAVVLWLTAKLVSAFGVRFEAPLFWPAFAGALVVTIVSTVLSWFLPREELRERDDS
jgi:putative membrane protein